MRDLVLVAGATGGTGYHVVQGLLKRGWPVLAMVRDGAAARERLPNAALRVADVTQPQTLDAALEGARYVICAIGSRAVEGAAVPEEIDYRGIAHLIDVAAAQGIEHFVLVSSIGVTQPDHPINRFGRVMDWKLRGEDHLRASGLPYTIIRPGGLRDVPMDNSLRIAQGDKISGMISRELVAEVCIEALGVQPAFMKTFEIIADELSPVPEDFPLVFAMLNTDKI